MAITYIDFYAENPIENKTIADSCIFENINGDGNALWTIYNSNDITITAEDTLYLNADRMWFNSSVEWTTIVSNSGMGFTTNPNSSGYSFTWNGNGGIWDVDTKGGDVRFNTYNSTSATYGTMVFPPVDKLQIAGGTNGQVLTTNGSGVLSWSTVGGGVSDGDKGDITVSGSGSVWTIDNSVVTYGKMQNASGHSVLGRSANTSGTIGEITSTANGQVLHRNGSNLVFGTIGDSSITASSITYSRLQNVSTNNRLLGRSTAGAGTIEEITVGSGLTLSAGTLSAGGGGLSYFTESQSTTGVNSTIYADTLTANGPLSGADIVLTPKGDGALLTKTPDGTSSGGNKRGINAIDFQFSRSNANQIAEGSRSVIIGGSGNRINSSSQDSNIFSGTNNQVLNSNASIINGISNYVSGYGGSIQCGGAGNTTNGGQYNGIFAGGSNTLGATSSVILGGSSNSNSSAGKSGMLAGEQNSITATGPFVTGGAIVGGRFNTLSASAYAQNAIIGGNGNLLSADNSVILGGESNFTSGPASNVVILGGNNNKVRSSFSVTSGRNGYNNVNCSSIISGSSSNSVYGSNQGGRIIMSCKTTTTSATKLLPIPSNGFEIMDGESVAYKGIICARTSANPGKSAYYEINGLIRNSSGTTTLLYSNLDTKYTDDATWVITQQIQALPFLEILFTGDANTYVTCQLLTSHSKWITS